MRFTVNVKMQVNSEKSEYTAIIYALGTFLILEAVSMLGLTEKNHLY